MSARDKSDTSSVVAYSETSDDLILTGIIAVIVAVPFAATSARPRFFRGVIRIGIVLALGIFTLGFFGDTGDMDRAGAVYAAGVDAVAFVTLWAVGAALARRVRRRATS
jgi:hypothetical protein